MNPWRRDKAAFHTLIDGIWKRGPWRGPWKLNLFKEETKRSNIKDRIVHLLLKLYKVNETYWDSLLWSKCCKQSCDRYRTYEAPKSEKIYSALGWGMETYSMVFTSIFSVKQEVNSNTKCGQYHKLLEVALLMIRLSSDVRTQKKRWKQMNMKHNILCSITPWSWF